ncbi:hypothetical protein DHEL01_v205476 [Diaporthe helianthi]|uniref:Uncharacterized protein n=1 Tax=Diaporthe helianthi TaxID=158607 RepID=A0A2P5I0T5_DIAHE|nr:hypothetical protein DHEL01_v205476 [Diaporthe helianthi]
MESLFYAIGVLLSGSFVLHFTSQFSYSIWLIYFIVAQMRPYLGLNDPWTPASTSPQVTRVELMTDEDSDFLFTRKAKHGSGAPSSFTWYLAWNSAWKANPTAMTIIASIYLVIDLVLIVWCAYIFALVVRLPRRERTSAVRTILSMTCNRLATPAFASSIMMAGYLCWGFWVWFSLCEPASSMRSLNLANALMLTVPNALFTILWIIGNGCEITDYVRGGPAHRQPELIPLPVIGVAEAIGGGGGRGVRGGGRRDVRDVLRQDIQIVLTQLARIMATLLAIRR